MILTIYNVREPSENAISAGECTQCRKLSPNRKILSKSGDIISYTVFYRGDTKIYWVHEKKLYMYWARRSRANTTFFMDPIYFRIPPVKHCVTNLSHRRPFCFLFSFFNNLTDQISSYIFLSRTLVRIISESTVYANCIGPTVMTDAN